MIPRPAAAFFGSTNSSTPACFITQNKSWLRRVPKYSVVRSENQTCGHMTVPSATPAGISKLKASVLKDRAGIFSCRDFSAGKVLKPMGDVPPQALTRLQPRPLTALLVLLRMSTEYLHEPPAAGISAQGLIFSMMKGGGSSDYFSEIQRFGGIGHVGSSLGWLVFRGHGTDQVIGWIEWYALRVGFEPEHTIFIGALTIYRVVDTLHGYSERAPPMTRVSDRRLPHRRHAL